MGIHVYYFVDCYLNTIVCQRFVGFFGSLV